MMTPLLQQNFLYIPKESRHENMGPKKIIIEDDKDSSNSGK